MDATKETERILEALNSYRKSLGWGASGALDRKLKRSEGYVGRLLSGKIGIRLAQLLDIVGKLGLKAGEFFAWVYGDECRIRPERFLGALEKNAEASPLLRQTDAVIAGMQSAPVRLKIGATPDRGEALRHLEDLRFSFPLRAREEGEALLRTIINTPEEAVDGAALCEVLAELGSVQRTLEAYPLSAAYLRRALDLAVSLGFARHEAGVYLRCCNLMADQGDLSIALACASRAREIYTLLHELAGVGKCLVDEGIIRRKSGDGLRAIQCYESALLYLPGDEWRNRVTVFHGLGVALLEQGQIDRSEQYLDRAYEEHRTREGYSWEKMAWLRGELALARENLEEAEAVFRSVRDHLALHDNALDVGMVSLRLAKVFLLSGRILEMRELVSELVELLQPLRGNSIAEGVLSDVVREALVGKVTADFLDRAYGQLERAAQS